jgi:feruloyl esterase
MQNIRLPEALRALVHSLRHDLLGRVQKSALALWAGASALAWLAATPTLSFDTNALRIACEAMLTTNHPSLTALNATILNATFYSAPANVTALGVCQPTATISVPLCRVEFVVNTSRISAITAETWLPVDFTGRLLGLGNGGLNGCECLRSDQIHQNC